MMDAAPMVNLCYRRQNPDSFGEAVFLSEPAVPASLRYGGEHVEQTLECIPEIEMGNGEPLP